ncbi:MAG: hypothetical protein LBT88_06775 [Oscillospiraceae bacterium]|jgi:predicted  nucleic acid-binding Zn-ribbon protein|nr:hypothetical protein [Oscillospiraceae bacterium]
MPNPKVKFHTELFGFRRADVAQYIEKLGRRYSHLEAELNGLRAELEDVNETRLRLAEEKLELLSGLSSIEDSRDKLAGIQAERDAIGQERDALKSQRERTIAKLAELVKFVESIGDA